MKPTTPREERDHREIHHGMVAPLIALFVGVVGFPSMPST